MDAHLFFEQASLWWGVPFAIFVLSLACAPLIIPRFWHTYDIHIAVVFCLSILGPMLLYMGFLPTKNLLLHMMQHSYIPFVIILCALFTVCGGVHITTTGTLSPLGNTLFLGVGSLLASIIGTTGASMLLIRPFLSLNHHRYGRKHLVIFFIFTVSNIGGMLTPMGDPPLFLGFLNGVDFFWTLRFLLTPYVLIMIPVLGLFYWMDHRSLLRHPLKESVERSLIPQNIQIYGKRNLLLLLGIVGIIVASGMWPSVLGRLRDLFLITLCLISYLVTPQSVRYMNRFSFAPLREVSIVFLAIFVTLIPLENMLHSGEKGPLGWLLSLASTEGHHDALRSYFLCGGLSSFLDNAPTYLLFFHMGGGDAQNLMTTDSLFLQSISLSAVAFGAMTYIGNAPNLLVKSLAERHNVVMPSFFGYMGWSLVLLLPILAIIGLILFR